MMSTILIANFHFLKKHCTLMLVIMLLQNKMIIIILKTMAKKLRKIHFYKKKNWCMYYSMKQYLYFFILYKPDILKFFNYYLKRNN